MTPSRYPSPDQCVDVVVARSVLIDVADKARAATEFHRVLRPSGRVSLYEPINSQYKSLADVDLSDLEPARSRVLERWLSGRDPGSAMGGFDDATSCATSWTPGSRPSS